MDINSPLVLIYFYGCNYLSENYGPEEEPFSTNNICLNNIISREGGTILVNQYWSTFLPECVRIHIKVNEFTFKLLFDRNLYEFEC